MAHPRPRVAQEAVARCQATSSGVVGDGEPLEGGLGLGVADEGPQRDLVAGAAGDPPPAAGADEHEFVAVVTAHAPGLADHLDAVDGRPSMAARSWLGVTVRGRRDADIVEPFRRCRCYTRIRSRVSRPRERVHSWRWTWTRFGRISRRSRPARRISTVRAGRRHRTSWPMRSARPWSRRSRTAAASRPPNARPRPRFADARSAMADLLAARPDGIVFGRSMTQLTFDLARTLAKTWRAGRRDRGDPARSRRERASVGHRGRARRRDDPLRRLRPGHRRADSRPHRRAAVGAHPAGGGHRRVEPVRHPSRPRHDRRPGARRRRAAVRRRRAPDRARLGRHRARSAPTCSRARRTSSSARTAECSPPTRACSSSCTPTSSSPSSDAVPERFELGHAAVRAAWPGTTRRGRLHRRPRRRRLVAARAARDVHGAESRSTRTGCASASRRPSPTCPA